MEENCLEAMQSLSRQMEKDGIYMKDGFLKYRVGVTVNVDRHSPSVLKALAVFPAAEKNAILRELLECSIDRLEKIVAVRSTVLNSAMGRKKERKRKARKNQGYKWLVKYRKKQREKQQAAAGNIAGNR